MTRRAARETVFIGTHIAHLQSRSRLERYACLFTRLSGVALVFLAITHMLIQHVLNDVHNLSLAFVRRMWRSWGWRAFDLLMLILATTHGFNGPRVVLEDYVHSPRAVNALRWTLVVGLIVTIIWPAVAILTFDARGNS